jgi:hypothetical protein
VPSEVILDSDSEAFSEEETDSHRQQDEEEEEEQEGQGQQQQQPQNQGPQSASLPGRQTSQGMRKSYPYTVCVQVLPPFWSTPLQSHM